MSEKNQTEEEKLQLKTTSGKNKIRVAFLQNVTEQLIGYMSLSAMLKNEGHECEVFLVNFEKDVLACLRKYDPDVVGVYAVTGNMAWAQDIIRDFKKYKPSCLTIFGGPHATYAPDHSITCGIDAICIGEGEGAMMEIARDYNGTSLDSIAKIKNLWVNTNGAVVKNGLRPIVEDLDSLPLPDREMYDKYSYFANIKAAPMLATRGCPFNCTYCFNHVARSLYKDLGKFVRYRSPESIVGEAIQLKNKYSLNHINFVDSTLNMKHSWFMDLMESYAENVDLPFFCHVYVDIVRTEQLDALAKANCQMVGFGIEGGSHRLRKDMLSRDMSDEMIYKLAEDLQKRKLKFVTANILGLPTETLEESYKLIKINQDVKPAAVGVAVFQPYPGTQLGQIALDKGLIDELNYDDMSNYYHGSVLIQEDIDMQVRLHKMFYYFVRFPKLSSLWDFLAKYAPMTALQFLFYFSLTLNVKKGYGYSWIEIIKYGLLNFLYYSKK